MIEVQLGILKSETFKNGLTKIYGHTNFPSLSIAFTCLSKIKLIRKEIETAEEMHKAIVERHSEKDGAGKPVIENNHYKIVDIEKLNTELFEFSKAEIKIYMEEIKLSELEGIKLSLSELESLENFLVVEKS